MAMNAKEALRRLKPVRGALVHSPKGGIRRNNHLLFPSYKAGTRP